MIKKYQKATLVTEDKTEEVEYKEIVQPHRLSQTVQSNPEHDAIWRQGFEIDIVYGQDDDVMGQPLHVILLDCHIMNVQTVLDSSGRPVLEQYQFLARDRKVINS